MERVTFKLSFGEDTTRWTVSTATATFKQLDTKAVKTFAVKEPKFKYKDEDGDSVILSCQEDLEECLAQKLNPVRLTLSEGTQPSPQEDKRASEQSKARKDEGGSTKAVHYGVSCDGCDVFPIVGPRFKSLTKADFDICEQCERKGKTSLNDLYVRIDHPGQTDTLPRMPRAGHVHEPSEVEDKDSQQSQSCGDKSEGLRSMKKLFDVFQQAGCDFDVNANIPANQGEHFMKVVQDFAPQVQDVLGGQKSPAALFGAFLSALSEEGSFGGADDVAATPQDAPPAKDPQGAPGRFSCYTSNAKACHASDAKPAPEVEASAVHNGVTCDACLVSPIVGPRFMSITKANYDLCESCHKTSEQDPELKDAYRRIDEPYWKRRCGKWGHGGHGGVGPWNPHKWGPGKWARGPMGGCHKWADWAPPQMGPWAAEAAAAAGAADFWQDRWEKKAARWARKQQGGGRHGQPIHLDARFVQDLTVSDGSYILAGSSFDKVWQMRNCGSEPWPEEVVLGYVGGDQLAPLPKVRVATPPGGLSPGEQVDIRMKMTAPVSPGRYTSYYRLMVPGGPKFGQRIWTTIQVISPQVKKIPPGASAPGGKASAACAPATLRSLSALSVSELKSLLPAHYVDYSGVIEKGELVALLAAAVGVFSTDPEPSQSQNGGLNQLCAEDNWLGGSRRGGGVPKSAEASEPRSEEPKDLLLDLAASLPEQLYTAPVQGFDQEVSYQLLGDSYRLLGDSYQLLGDSDLLPPPPCPSALLVPPPASEPHEELLASGPPPALGASIASEAQSPTGNELSDAAVESLLYEIIAGSPDNTPDPMVEPLTVQLDGGDELVTPAALPNNMLAEVDASKMTAAATVVTAAAVRRRSIDKSAATAAATATAPVVNQTQAPSMPTVPLAAGPEPVPGLTAMDDQEEDKEGPPQVKVPQLTEDSSAGSGSQLTEDSSAGSGSSAVSSSKAATTGQWAKELAFLADIGFRGFRDETVNVFLLEQFEGKVPAVVTALIKMNNDDGGDADDWERVSQGSGDEGNMNDGTMGA